MAEKYDIKTKLRKMMRTDFIAIQGEIIGPKIQKNRLNRAKHEFYVFSLRDEKNGHYIGSLEAAKRCNNVGLNFVPIVAAYVYLPDTVEKVKKITAGPSKVNPSVRREGLVIRSVNGSVSFKSVDPAYLNGEPLDHNSWNGELTGVE